MSCVCVCVCLCVCVCACVCNYCFFPFAGVIIRDQHLGFDP